MACTLRTRKFLTNRLLQRKQFVSWARDNGPFYIAQRLYSGNTRGLG